MSGTQAGGAGVAVLGAGAASAEAAHLAVGAVHHLHELPAPEFMGARGTRGGVTARMLCTQPASGPHWASPRNFQKDISGSWCLCIVSAPMMLQREEFGKLTFDANGW